MGAVLRRRDPITRREQASKLQMKAVASPATTDS